MTGMDAILEALASYGIAGIFLAVLVYYLNKLPTYTAKNGRTGKWQTIST
jgi:hypothetical protein